MRHAPLAILTFLCVTLSGCDLFPEDPVGAAIESMLVSLTWESTADLDLEVVEPSGNRISFSNRTSSSGGTHSGDNVSGYGPESVSWQRGAPGGTYRVQVKQYSGGSPSNYRVVVQGAGATQTVTGTVSPGQTVTATTIDVRDGTLTVAGGSGGGGSGGGSSSTTLLNQTGLEGARDSQRFFQITVPSGARSLEITMTEGQYGSNMGDLFVRRGQRPSVSRQSYTTGNFTADCSSIEPNRATERCVFNNPAAGDWHILIFGYHAYYGAVLTATVHH